MPTTYAIPTLMEHKTPNLDSKETAHASGKLVWDVTPLKAEDILPDIRVVMSLDNGAEVKRVLIDPDQILLLKVRHEDGSHWAQLQIETSKAELDPGTYVLSAMQGSEEIARKWATVIPHSHRVSTVITNDELPPAASRSATISDWLEAETIIDGGTV